MEIVQIQSRDDKESIAKMNMPAPPLIKIPRPELSEDKSHPSVTAEEELESVKHEDRTVHVVQEGQEHGKKEDRCVEVLQEEEKEECTTPRGKASRIPDPFVCPPPPARRSTQGIKRTREIPQERFFPVPEDLNSVFIPRKKIRPV